MKVKLNKAYYKVFLNEDWVNVGVDGTMLAWVINRALVSIGADPMFEIDDTTGEEALVILASVSDSYGGQDALDILFPDEINMKLVEYHDRGDTHAVFRKKDGRLLGFLISYFGNNGRGRLAAQDFDPAPGVRIRFK